MEKIVNNRFQQLLKRRQLISRYQGDFRQFRSIYDHPINLETDICDAFVNNQYTTTLYFDTEKSCDIIWKNRIIRILQEYGFSGNFFNFVNNFSLEDPNFSSPTILKNDMLRGTVLSLFLIVVNNMQNIVCNSIKSLLFANDLILICEKPFYYPDITTTYIRQTPGMVAQFSL